MTTTYKEATSKTSVSAVAVRSRRQLFQLNGVEFPTIPSAKFVFDSRIRHLVFPPFFPPKLSGLQWTGLDHIGREKAGLAMFS